jgi:hypothetical protein
MSNRPVGSRLSGSVSRHRQEQQHMLLILCSHMRVPALIPVSIIRADKRLCCL